MSIEDVEKQWLIDNPPQAFSEPFPGDDNATWIYWTKLDTLDAGVNDDWVWERLRTHRDRLLTKTDYRMVVDAPWDLVPWIDYRKALRDLPKNTKDPRLAEWPVAPNE